MKKKCHLIYIAVAAMLLIVALGCSGCQQEEELPQEFSQISPICELATLKCYYHNVADKEVGADSLFRLGYHKVWIEYSGIVDVGIDAGKVKVTPSETDPNRLKVTIPKAQVLDIDFDTDSIKTLVEKGTFSSQTTQDDMLVFNEAQENMKQTAAADENMLNQAQTRAKTLLENYLKKCGEAVGRTYTIEWVELDTPADTATTVAPASTNDAGSATTAQ